MPKYMVMGVCNIGAYAILGRMQYWGVCNTPLQGFTSMLRFLCLRILQNFSVGAQLFPIPSRLSCLVEERDRKSCKYLNKINLIFREYR